MIARRDKTMLLTGATGFLGHYLLAELMRRTSWCVRVLVRQADASAHRLAKLLKDLEWDLGELQRQGRVEIVQGRLPQPFDAASLRGVETVVHAAGSTRFQPDAEGEPMRTNVDGTRELLDRAGESGVRHFVYTSTAYVCGNRSGRIEECLPQEPPAFCNAYEESKATAERMVWQWRNRDRVATICRPSILFGDSRTGRSTSQTGVYLIARATELLAKAVESDQCSDRYHIPLRILGRPEATCNLIPVDLVAERIVDAIVDPACHGRVHHITNPSPPTHADIKAWLEEYFDIAGGRFHARSSPPVDPNAYEDLFYSFGNVLRDYFRDGLSFQSHAHGSDLRPLVYRESFLRSLRLAEFGKWARSSGHAEQLAAHKTLIDPDWYFRTFLPDNIAQSSVARVAGLTAAVRFVVGNVTKHWTCWYKAGRLIDVQTGQGESNADFGFRVSEQAFAALVTGQCVLQRAFFNGEADIFGQVERALKFVPIMAAFIEEFPVRVS